MANVFKKLFNKERWESFLYTDEDDYDDDDFFDEDDYYPSERVPFYDMSETPDVTYVDVETGKEIDYIPARSRNTQSIKYQHRERQLTREQRELLAELQAQMDYEFVMNGHITQKRVHEIFGLDNRPVEQEEANGEEI